MTETGNETRGGKIWDKKRDEGKGRRVAGKGNSVRGGHWLNDTYEEYSKD